MGLSYDIFQSYFDAIIHLEAEQTLVNFNISDYPHLKKDGRKKLRDPYYKIYNEIRNQLTPVMTTEEFFKSLSRIG